MATAVADGIRDGETGGPGRRLSAAAAPAAGSDLVALGAAGPRKSDSFRESFAELSLDSAEFDFEIPVKHRQIASDDDGNGVDNADGNYIGENITHDREDADNKTTSSSRHDLPPPPIASRHTPGSSSPYATDSTGSPSPSAASSMTGTSPNATTISSHTSSLLHTRSGTSLGSGSLSPANRLSTVGAPGAHPAARASKRAHHEFKALSSELTRFISKTGANKANTLRLALLPFLRQCRAAIPPPPPSSPREDNPQRPLPEDVRYRLKVLHKWWTAILSAFANRQVSGADRSAYLEGLSGLIARREWLYDRTIYSALLYETVQLVIGKLCLKSLPLSVAAFSGKVLAYAFFYAPKVAPVLLHLLAVSPNAANRILSVSLSAGELDTFVEMLAPDMPDHLVPLMGLIECPVQRPPTPPGLDILYGPWVRRWSTPTSDVFYAFLKHYYAIMSGIISPELPWNAHLAAPGLVLIHAFILNGLDYIVHPKNVSDKLQTYEEELNAVAVNPIMMSTPRRRVDQLRLLETIREILHNDDACVNFFEPYCRQFERILHAVAFGTSVYDVESCVVLADLVEEYLSSLILSHSLTRQRVQIQKDKVIDWTFWILVARRMLSSENCHTELRALAFLFNIWENIPIGATVDNCSLDRSMLEDFLPDQQEGLRWNCTLWLLSPANWKRYFCHWQPLVRAYYHRLLVWRIGSVGPESELLTSILFSNYNVDARGYLHNRLKTTYANACRLIELARATQRPPPDMSPDNPVVNRRMCIMINPASTPQMRSAQSSPFSSRGSPRVGQPPNGYFSPGNGSVPPMAPPSGPPSAGSMARPMVPGNGRHLHRVNKFDVFDDIAYSYPPMASPKDTLFTPDSFASSARDSVETVRTSHTVVGETPQPNAAVADNQRSMKEPDDLSVPPRRKWSGFFKQGAMSVKKYFGARSVSAPRPQALDEGSSNVDQSGGIHMGDGPQRSMSMTSVRTAATDTMSVTSSASSRSVMTQSTGSSLHRSLSKTPKSSPSLRGHNGMSQDSLTTSLIPPPPQLLRQRPEISRPPYKFCLDFDDTAARRQMELVMNGRHADRASRFVSLQTSLFDLPPKPRLPFEFQANSYGYERMTDFEFGWSDSEDSTSSGFITAESSPSASQLRAAQVAKNSGIPSVVDDVEDVKYWKYSAKSLVEWEATVREFEEFVRNRKMMAGISRLEDIGVPFLVAEIPPRALAG